MIEQGIKHRQTHNLHYLAREGQLVHVLQLVLALQLRKLEAQLCRLLVGKHANDFGRFESI